MLCYVLCWCVLLCLVMLFCDVLCFGVCCRGVLRGGGLRVVFACVGVLWCIMMYVFVL